MKNFFNFVWHSDSHLHVVWFLSDFRCFHVVMDKICTDTDYDAFINSHIRLNIIYDSNSIQFIYIAPNHNKCHRKAIQSNSSQLESNSMWS